MCPGSLSKSKGDEGGYRKGHKQKALWGDLGGFQFGNTRRPVFATPQGLSTPFHAAGHRQGQANAFKLRERAAPSEGEEGRACGRVRRVPLGAGGCVSSGVPGVRPPGIDHNIPQPSTTHYLILFRVAQAASRGELVA